MISGAARKPSSPGRLLPYRPIRFLYCTGLLGALASILDLGGKVFTVIVALLAVLVFLFNR